MQHLIQICGEKSLHIHGQHKNIPEHIESVLRAQVWGVQAGSTQLHTTRILTNQNRKDKSYL